MPIDTMEEKVIEKWRCISLLALRTSLGKLLKNSNIFITYITNYNIPIKSTCKSQNFTYTFILILSCENNIKTEKKDRFLDLSDCWQKPIPFRKNIGFLLYIGNFRNEIVFFCIFWRMYWIFWWLSSIFSSPKGHFLQIMARKNQPSILLVFLQAF